MLVQGAEVSRVRGGADAGAITSHLAETHGYTHIKMFAFKSNSKG